MKRIYYLLALTFLFFASCEKEEELIDLNAEKQLPKIEVCHYDSYTNTWKTISISENALKAHLAHGDFEGSCENRKTYVPDDAFETFLICKGYDDVLDDYVLTSNIDKIEKLKLPYDGDGDGDCGWDPNFYIGTLTGIEDFISLKSLYFGGTLDIDLDLSTLVELEYLTIDEPFGLQNLNTSGCIALKEIKIIGCWCLPILTLDLTKNIALSNLYLERCMLQSLDLSQNTALTKLLIYGYGYPQATLSRLDLSKNYLLEEVEVGGYINLSCIEVADEEYANENWGTDVVFSENCSY